jgi:hypothetical protein
MQDSLVFGHIVKPVSFHGNAHAPVEPWVPCVMDYK